MPWEITIRRKDGLPLGPQADVKTSLTAIFPGARFYQEPSGAEKLAALRAQGVEFPDLLRRHFEATPSTEQGDFEGDGFSLRFFLGAGPEITKLDAEVRGSAQRAYPFLRSLAAANRWVVAEVGDPAPM